MARFYNQATLTYNDNVTNSNIVTGEIVEVLSAAKTAVDSEYSAGDSVTYVISIVNTGMTPFNNLTVTDDLGAYHSCSQTLVPLTYVKDSAKYYINGTLQKCVTAEACPPLTFSGINVPAGGSVIIVYKADVNDFAPLTRKGKITNTATISGDSLSTPITVSETVCTRDEPVLSICKSICPTEVSENGQLTYTFVIQNTGNTAATAEDNAVVSDTFDPILNQLCVTFNNKSWEEHKNYSYNEGTGEFRTNHCQITVPAATITQDQDTGRWIVTPGVSTLTVTGTI